MGSGTTHTNGYRYYAGLRLEGVYPTIPFDSLTLTNIEGSEKIDNLGEIIDAGGWDLLEQLFYAGEPVIKPQLHRYWFQSMNESQVQRCI